VAIYRRRGNDTAAWVAYTEEQSQGQTHEQARWVQGQLDKTGMPVALRASSMLMHVEAIRAGTGRGVLPCYIGDGHPLLERLTSPIPELAATAKAVAEGAGALAYAALEQLEPGPPTVAVVSGGNIDPHLLASLLN